MAWSWQADQISTLVRPISRNCSQSWSVVRSGIAVNVGKIKGNVHYKVSISSAVWPANGSAEYGRWRLGWWNDGSQRGGHIVAMNAMHADGTVAKAPRQCCPQFKCWPQLHTHSCCEVVLCQEWQWRAVNALLTKVLQHTKNLSVNWPLTTDTDL